MSWYLTIRGAADYSRFAATDALVEFLSTMPELRRTGPLEFRSADGQPWVVVVLAVCDSAGNYASTGECQPRVNAIEIVCSYSCEPPWYDALAGRIAGFLGWSVLADHEE